MIVMQVNPPMPGRSIVGGYSYAFQGQEKDAETGKEAFELRLWDSRIGRWLTTDPVRQFHSPYIGIGNDPIKHIDIKGDSVWVYTERIKRLGNSFGHLFLRVKTDNVDVTLELTGKKKFTDGTYSRTGVSVMKGFHPKYTFNGRCPVGNPILITGDTKDYRFEKNIFRVFSEFLDRKDFPNGKFDYPKLPDYNLLGPNSNGFAHFLLFVAGSVKLGGGPGLPGLSVIEPYYDQDVIYLPEITLILGDQNNSIDLGTLLLDVKLVN